MIGLLKQGQQGQQTTNGLLEQILVELKTSRRVGGAPEDPKPKNKGGRPETHNWRPFYLEVTRIANYDGINSRAELRRCMKEWVTNNMKVLPHDSLVRDRLREIGDYLNLPPD
jgi:hypothetical protein